MWLEQHTNPARNSEFIIRVIPESHPQLPLSELALYVRTRFPAGLISRAIPPTRLSPQRTLCDYRAASVFAEARSRAAIRFIRVKVIYVRCITRELPDE